jgi:multiple sugar transport system permease protein
MTRPGQASPWWLLAPMLAVVAVVAGYPVLQTIVLSVTDTRLLGGFRAAHWVGFDNFVYALTDPDFQAATLHTLHFTVLSVGFETLFGLLVALLLNERFAGRTLCRSLLVIPWALPTIVNAVMWRLIYQPDFGVLNAMLVQSGLLPAYRSWLGDPASAMNAVVFADVWKNYPLVALIVLAALQNAPADLYEAARLDGAGPLRRFQVVTWPAIAPALLVAVVLRTIEALKVFDIVYAMTRGGPASTTKTMSFFVYEESFRFLRVGSGASYALVLVLVCTVLVALYVRLIGRRPAA